MLTMTQMHYLCRWQVVGKGSSALPHQPRAVRPPLPVAEAVRARKLMGEGLNRVLSPSGLACVEWTIL